MDCAARSSPGAWAKWFFLVAYAAYGLDTGSFFMADSRRPRATLRCLSVAAGLLPVVYVGGSWVVARLGNVTGDGAVTGSLLAAGTRFWGPAAVPLVTFLIAAGCLLSSLTAAAGCPRMLYQLAKDGHAAPAFGVLSSRSVQPLAVGYVAALSVGFVLLGNPTVVLVTSATGYFAACILLHFGIWNRRRDRQAPWPRLALGAAIFESAVFVLALRSFVVVAGLVIPALLVVVDRLIARLPARLADPDLVVVPSPSSGQTRSPLDARPYCRADRPGIGSLSAGMDRQLLALAGQQRPAARGARCAVGRRRRFPRHFGSYLDGALPPGPRRCRSPAQREPGRGCR
ncbi:MAG TPA: amino acid permease [Acidimicrobiales bacterium]|nr:amino acid permease [Acidimicrobiales bacterium]